MTDGLTEVLNRRQAAADRVIRALSHLPHEHAMYIVMAWIELDRLERLADFQERNPPEVTITSTRGEGVDGQES